MTEPTMIYRKPVKDSDPLAIQDIWGQQLETRTVDASEVGALAADGWVTHPDHIDSPPPKLKQVADLQPALDDATAKMAEMSKRIADVTAQHTKLDAENSALKEQIAKLQSELRAAEELLGSDKGASKQTLGVKTK